MVRTIRDADDYTDYPEDGPPIYPMISTRRWEKMSGQPWRAIYQDIYQGNYCGGYLTWSQFFDAKLERCFLWDVQVEMCTLRNCHVHYTERYALAGCAFYDCVLTTPRGGHASVTFLNGVLLSNCTLRGNFTQAPVGRVDLQREAENPSAVQALPYEVHNNIVFKDCVLDCLRRWVSNFRYNKKTACFKRVAPNKLFKAPVWRGKVAGKQPMHVDDRYDAVEQMDTPARRCEWDVDHTWPVMMSPPRKRKIGIDLTMDD